MVHLPGFRTAHRDDRPRSESILPPAQKKHHGACFEAQLLVTQLLEIPFHIPNAYIKIKYRYRNKVYRYKSGLVHINGFDGCSSCSVLDLSSIGRGRDASGAGSPSTLSLSTQRSRPPSTHSHSTTGSRHNSEEQRFVYRIPLPPSLHLQINQASHVLEPFLIHCKIRSKSKKKALKKIGEVCINLAEFANHKDPVPRRYLLHKCKMNALLCVNVAMVQLSGDKFFRCPKENSFYDSAPSRKRKSSPSTERHKPSAALSTNSSQTNGTVDATCASSAGNAEHSTLVHHSPPSLNASNSIMLASDTQSSLNHSFDFDQFSASQTSTNISAHHHHYRNNSALVVENVILESLSKTPPHHHRRSATDPTGVSSASLEAASLDVSSLSESIERDLPRNDNPPRPQVSSFSQYHKTHAPEDDDDESDATPVSTLSPPLYDSIIGSMCAGE